MITLENCGMYCLNEYTIYIKIIAAIIDSIITAISDDIRIDAGGEDIDGNDGDGIDIGVTFFAWSG
jgi:hypothetical protein